MFCRCPNGAGGGPNTQTCPVCLAFPVRCRCRTARRSRRRSSSGWRSARRSPTGPSSTARATSTPTTPKAYQISQYDEPLCAGGRLLVPTPDGDYEVRINRAHLEEDAAKNVHVAESGRIHGATATLVDFNRGGSPLVEIVTEPDIHSADRRSDSSSCCARRSSSSGSRTPSSRRDRCASTSTSRCARPGPTSSAPAPS